MPSSLKIAARRKTTNQKIEITSAANAIGDRRQWLRCHKLVPNHKNIELKPKNTTAYPKFRGETL
jgi:hypothetical protein